MEKTEKVPFVMTTTDGGDLKIVKHMGIVNTKASIDTDFPTAMMKVQQKLHGMAVEMGASAVIGLRMMFGEYNIIGYGTAVFHEPRQVAENASKPSSPARRPRQKSKKSVREQTQLSQRTDVKNKPDPVNNFVFPPM